MKPVLRNTGNRHRRTGSLALAGAVMALVLAAVMAPLRAADVSVRIFERGGKDPLQDAAVCLGTPAQHAQFGAGVTGPDGTVVFRDVPRASLVVTASKTGYKGEQQSLITGNTNRMLILSLPAGGGGAVCSTGTGHVTAEPGGIRVRNFRINNGAETTPDRQVVLNLEADGSPSQYRASEDLDFAGAEWLTYSAEPVFRLSAGDGRKDVYLQLRRSSAMAGGNIEVLSPVVQDTIILRQH